MIKSNFLHTLFLICLFPALMFGQAPIMKHYTVEDGLPSSMIYQVIQDQKGFIWVATDKGVARFDGYDFEVFTVNEGLPFNDVWHLDEDKNGRIWLSTYDKVCYLKNDTVFSLPIPEDLDIEGQVNHQFFEDGTVHIIYADPGLSIYEILPNDSIRVIALTTNTVEIQGFTSNKLTPLFLKKEGPETFWVCHPFPIKSMLSVLKKEGQQFFFHQNIKTGATDVPTRGLKPFQLENSSTIFISTPQNVFKYDLKNIVQYPINEILNKEGRIKYLIPIGNQKLQINTSEGNYIVNQNLELLPEYSFLEEMNINSLCEDKFNNLWLSTPHGLFLLGSQGKKSKNIHFSEDIYKNEVTALNKSLDSSIWIGTQDGRLFSLKPDMSIEEKMLQLNNSRNNKTINCIYPTLDNGLLIALPVGLFFIPSKEFNLPEINRNYFPKLWQEFELFNEEYYISKDVKSIVQNKKNQFYFGGTGYIRKTEKGGKFRPLHPLFRSNSLEIDGNEHLWIGYRNGIEVFDEKNNKPIDLEQPFTKPVNILKKDGYNQIWIGTDGYGLYRYHNNVFYHLPETKKDVINSLFYKEPNQIWAATSQGIRKITVQNIEPFKYNIKNFTTAQGLSSNEVNQVVIRDGKIYAGTRMGLSILEELDTSTIVEKPKLSFRNIEIATEKQALLDNYKLAHYQNHIKIEYLCLSYKSISNISYQYKMEGIDTSWQTTNSLSREYPFLPPDDYVFHLKATDIDGMETDTLSVSFSIYYPWWQTPFAIFSWIVLSIALIAGVFQWRLRIAEQKVVEQNEINKKFAELELKALQAQMNPHFVFNALHAIQDFIFEKEELEANRYLVKFSSLMRLYLESSKEKYIFIQDEIRLLRLYIELEKLRFEEQLDYDIQIEEDLEDQNVEIPSMLIQPFVENAINHGIVNKRTKGFLWLRIFKEGDYIFAIVKDDGVGRAKAREIRQRSYKNYKSRGTQIVEERHRIFNYIENTDIEIEVEDLFNENQVACGTEVTIKMPLVF